MSPWNRPALASLSILDIGLNAAPRSHGPWELWPPSKCRVAFRAQQLGPSVHRAPAVVGLEMHSHVTLSNLHFRLALGLCQEDRLGRWARDRLMTTESSGSKGPSRRG